MPRPAKSKPADSAKKRWFGDSDTALRDSAFLQSETKPQVVSEAKENFRKDDDVRWQWSGAIKTPAGSPHLFSTLLHELMTAKTRVHELKIPEPVN